ncbi:ceramide kinase isoform X2 [Anoplophora glabripennis]|uniref:ceramide kinase isoform X2 n=1 Tax=Anoplophora glabripennis TaxID=217634 RepID=UPI00087371C5|nr:ceramide kinase isoform X2 [Anoplophora glabripennis]
MCSDIHNSVLLSTFYSGKKKLRIIFHKGNIVWDNEKPPSAVQHNYLRNTHPSENKQIDPNSFTIHYSERGKYAKWVYKNVSLKHSDPLQVSTWIKTLQNYLQRLKKRPKHLLLFVNPFGGKRNALQIYEKYGKHLFIVAGIEVTVNISQRKDQIKDYIVNHNLDMFDSVACVGGDGTLSELFNGLVLRECRLRGIDADDINQNLPKPKIPVGVIPGGSTDTIAYCIHGTTDPTTAVLHIIFGDSLGLDLVSVYDEHSLLRLYASVLSYGYLGDVAYNSDQYRWMGPRRYDYSGFKKLVRNKGYQGEIAVYSESESVEETTCRENCERCELNKKTECDKLGCKWQTLSGKFFMVSGANISCACSRSPKGIAPYSHLGDGMVHLVLVKHTTVLNNLRLLLRLSSADSTVEDLPFVETVSAREFCFRAVGGHSRWNCDGEVQHQTNIRAKVRCQLLTIFSRGSPRYAPPKSTCCGF